jgi:hypothetical protein
MSETQASCWHTQIAFETTSSSLKLSSAYILSASSAAMPIGIRRFNAKKSEPNGRVCFIKPLKGPDEAIARDFLERIAAQCCMSYCKLMLESRR